MQVHMKKQRRKPMVLTSPSSLARSRRAPTPMQHVVYQLTDAKVHAQATPEDYQTPDPTPRFLLQWATATGAIAVGKCKQRDTEDDDVHSSAYAEDEDEDEDGGNSGSD